MDSQKIYILLFTVSSAIVTVAWWIAAIKKPGVALFFWLATMHTVSLGVGIFTILTPPATYAGWIFPVHLVLALVEAGLGVQLVRWIVSRP